MHSAAARKNRLPIGSLVRIEFPSKVGPFSDVREGDVSLQRLQVDGDAVQLAGQAFDVAVRRSLLSDDSVQLLHDVAKDRSSSDRNSAILAVDSSHQGHAEHQQEAYHSDAREW